MVSAKGERVVLLAAVEAEPEVALAGEVHVEAEVCSAEHVEMAVGLRLHSVGPEVGDDAEASGRIGLGELDRESGRTGEERRPPELSLAHVLYRCYEVHDGGPVQCVVKCDQFIVLVADLARELAGGYAAECALRPSRPQAALEDIAAALLPDASGLAVVWRRDGYFGNHAGVVEA